MIKKFNKFKKRKIRIKPITKDKDLSYNWLPLHNDASPSPGTNISIGLIKDYN